MGYLSFSLSLKGIYKKKKNPPPPPASPNTHAPAPTHAYTAHTIEHVSDVGRLREVDGVLAVAVLNLRMKSAPGMSACQVCINLSTARAAVRKQRQRHIHPRISHVCHQQFDDVLPPRVRRLVQGRVRKQRQIFGVRRFLPKQRQRETYPRVSHVGHQQVDNVLPPRVCGLVQRRVSRVVLHVNLGPRPQQGFDSARVSKIAGKVECSPPDAPFASPCLVSGV